MKLTRWFPITTDPIRPGVYQIQLPRIECYFYSYFDGGYWYGAWLSIARAEEFATKHFKDDSKYFAKWRGIIKDKA